MKHTVRHASLLHATAMILPGIALAVVCVAQVASGASGASWSPVLAGASGVLAIMLWAGVGTDAAAASPRRAAIADAGRWSFARMHGQVFVFLLSAAWWSSGWVCCAALFNEMTGGDRPLGPAALAGAVIGIGMLLFADFVRFGRINGVIFAPGDFEARRNELARQREEILATARQNFMN